MDLTIVKNVVTRNGARGLLLTKKYAPQILTGLGIVAGVTGTVLAAKATLNVKEVLDEHNEHVDLLKEYREQQINGKPMVENYPRELAFVYAKTGFRMLKLYGPALSFGVLSIACTISAQGIMQQRQAGLMAAYTAVERSFSEYRKRVEAHIGAEQAEVLKYGLKEERKDNTEKGIVETVKTADALHSPHSRFFDELSPAWDKTPEYNLIFLRGQQQMANDLLQARGHVFLNDVYDALGIPRSQAGAVVGWVLKKGNQNHVDFGIFDETNEAKRAFVNGQEAAILLDFNVDGIIFDQI